MKKVTVFVVLMGSLFGLTTSKSGVCQDILFTDADAGARIICRNDQDAAACFTPFGDATNIRVHDQNSSVSGYWHFDLSDVDSNANVLGARFQLDLQSNSWSDNTSVSVFAIVDTDKDWDLNDLVETEIIGANAPQSDYESFEWTGDPNDPQQRFNAPTPFLEEGDLPSSTVRLLEEFIDIPGTDSLTSGEPGEPGNEYGGYAGVDGPGTGGSSDGDDNPWPIKNAVDIDVTDLIQWKLGHNPAYSDFDPTDSELTVVVRTDFPEAGENGFARFIARESLFLGGSLDLQPGRITLDLDVPPRIPCDFDGNEACDISDLDALLYEGQAQQILAPYDLNSDGVVNLADRDEWYTLASAENGVDLVPGDTNLDGLVVASDLNDLGTNWQSTTATSVAQGDFNGDGLVAAADLNDIGINWQHGVAAAAVPEPSGCLALLTSFVILVAGFRRR